MVRNLWEIEQTTSGFRVRVLPPAGEIQQPWENYMCDQIHSISGTDIAGYGTRQANNQRKFPVREDDKRELLIYFNKDQSSPVSYLIEYVNNQPTWTDDTAGILKAISDVASWCGDVSTSLSNIEGVISGNLEVPSTAQDIVPLNAGTTTTGVKAFSILFEGSGGSFGGVPVVTGYSTGKAASLGNTLASEAYIVPNVADPNFPNSPRVLIEYIT